jgi:hypothetical protein
LIKSAQKTALWQTHCELGKVKLLCSNERLEIFCRETDFQLRRRKKIFCVLVFFLLADVNQVQFEKPIFEDPQLVLEKVASARGV